ncbi:Na+/H+ antiporter subunit E [Streptomyces hoynatensis]|uniref:Na+/H+ antiporter subunit E n=1 Tax=Streptomyces hoynatensis TaxID=1141874 RepID=UPI00131A3762|nr:Na+/H+ antiporter subunit E [Streptomyces hoynatensis]
MSRGRANRATRVTGFVLVWAGLLFLAYWVLIGPVSALELLVGAGGALLAGGAVEGMRRAERQPWGGAERLGAAVAAFPVTLLRETWQLALAVLAALRGRRAAGRVVRVRLAPGVGPSWAAALLSASPGSCVLDIAGDGQGRGCELTVHVLATAVSPLEAALRGERAP